MNRKVLILFLFLSFSLHAEEKENIDLIINVKRYFIVINGSSYSDASGIKVELVKKNDPVVEICSDPDATHDQFIEVMDELRQLGVRKIRIRSELDCK